MSDIMQFLAHWTLIGVLTFFVIGTLACLMGLIVVPKRWKIAAFVLSGVVVLATVVGRYWGDRHLRRTT